MTETDHYPMEKKQGCGVMELYNGVFRRRNFWRRTSSSSSIPTEALSSTQNGNNEFNTKRRRGGLDDAATAEKQNHVEQKYVVTRSPANSGIPPPTRYQVNGSKQSSDVTSCCNGGLANQSSKLQTQISISGELESFMTDYHGRGNLVRASSGNMMVFGNLGNIRQKGNAGSTMRSDGIHNYPPTGKSNGKPLNRVTGVNQIDTAVKNENKTVEKVENTEPEEGLCKALSRRLEPEELKILGNEEFKNGKYAEALAYYDLAITIDPDKASYRSNKSAALTGLGHLLEAVEECKEAIRIEPSYHRAHHRLGTLYFRLGEAEKASKQFKQSSHEADPKEIAKAQALQANIVRCNEARKHKDWNTMLKEAESAICSGADSSPQLFALKAEALLKLHSHQEADIAFSSRHVFDPVASIKFFGSFASSYYFAIESLVDLAAGRFEEAVKAAERAAQLDPGNKETAMIARKARAVAAARSKGNEFFKASKYREACSAYAEGLHHDQLNAVLLCNRAACRVKLGQWEKAIEDCNLALNVRPSYSKARLRRADCNAKLERWEDSIQDYEALIRESPADEEVAKALFEAQAQLKKSRREDVEVTPSSSNTNLIVDEFRENVRSPSNYPP